MGEKLIYELSGGAQGRKRDVGCNLAGVGGAAGMQEQKAGQRPGVEVQDGQRRQAATIKPGFLHIPRRILRLRVR